MDLLFFYKALAVGFAIAAPVGPIGALCIQRTLKRGLPAGLEVGLGAALADGTYGAVAAFGLVSVMDFFVAWQDVLKIGGGVFLILLGIKAIVIYADADRLPERPSLPFLAPGGKLGLAGEVITTYALTLTNPMTILSFIAIFAGLGLMHAGGETSQSIGLTVGVFVGSALWWVLLSGFVTAIRGRIPDTALPWINRFAGALLIGFGAAAITT